MRKARTPECGEAGWRVVGLGWAQVEPGIWDRFLIRKCKHCHNLDVEQIVWVELDLPLCLACLSQRVRALPDYTEPRHYLCLDCKATTWLEDP